MCEWMNVFYVELKYMYLWFIYTGLGFYEQLYLVI